MPKESEKGAPPAVVKQHICPQCGARMFTQPAKLYCPLCRYVKILKVVVYALCMLWAQRVIAAAPSSPTPKICTGLSSVAWEQDPLDLVEWWTLFVDGTALPSWPVQQVTPRPTPNQYEHPITPMPTGPFWMVACNSDQCSDPSNVMICVTATPTPTLTPTPPPTLTPTPVPTKTKKPKPHPPKWLDWFWW